MTGTKGHSGGKRPGQGRPKKHGDEYLIKIRCDEATFRAIIANTTPEQRADDLALLAELNKDHPQKY